MSTETKQAPTGQALDVALAVCGRETGEGEVCGQPAAVWALFDTDYWDGRQASACVEHSAELLDRDGVLVSSDAPILCDEDPR